MKKLPLTQKLDRRLLHTTDERIKLLREMEIETIGDFLQFFPRDHEDFSSPTNLAELRADQKNLLKGKFLRVRTERSQKGMNLTKATFEEEQSGGQVECVWFNNPTIKKRIIINQTVLITAKAKLGFGKISLQSPEFEFGEGGVHLGRISPVYREHAQLKNSWIRQKMNEILGQAEDFSDLLPKNIREEEGLFSKQKAVEQIHFPDSSDELAIAKKTIAFEELFLLQIGALQRKKLWEDQGKGESPKIPLDADLMKSFFEKLPFTPTNSQKIAIFEILKDFERPVPMLRLLEGDVGAGKTLVAIASSLPILKQNLQVAFLAPTEILAQQHFVGIEKMFHLFNPSVKVEILTGSTKQKDRRNILENLKSGNIHVLVGTHALLEPIVKFQKLGFVTIDEQHRFGVHQREKLIQKGSPHVLQMTATPIPRTLAIVAFGDQDLSVLTELPPGRKEITTKVVAPSGRRQIELFIESEIKKGRQGFVICPLVEESEKLEVKSATEEFTRLQEHIFPHLKLALLHGRMKSAEKDEIMRQFKEKKYDLLVSTSVVEVGVDVPNATIMLIEGAERFGLSQLHQFRGRVGRGEHQSYCFLFPTEKVTMRLKAMEKESCGFHLAEIDMRLRGCGELFGTRQSGMPDMKMADLSDVRVISSARKYAEEYLEGGGSDTEIFKAVGEMEYVSQT